MICKICALAAENGEHGMTAHIPCPSLGMVNVVIGERKGKKVVKPEIQIVNPTACDCQHKEPIWEATR